MTIKKLFDVYIKITVVIILFTSLISCKRDYVCSCEDYNYLSGQTTEISREVIKDTKKNAKKKCSDKWCGDECGCSIK